MKPRSIALCALAGLSLVPALVGQSSDPLTAEKLKEMIVNLGFEPKALNEEVGKEKYEFTVKAEGFDVPIAAEISASKNYVWLTVYLGDAPADSSPKIPALLKKNHKIQPCQFYITEKGALMMAIAMDNRGITPAVFKRAYTKLSDDVSGTADVWNADQGPAWAQ